MFEASLPSITEDCQCQPFPTLHAIGSCKRGRAGEGYASNTSNTSRRYKVEMYPTMTQPYDAAQVVAYYVLLGQILRKKNKCPKYVIIYFLSRLHFHFKRQERRLLDEYAYNSQMHLLCQTTECAHILSREEVSTYNDECESSDSERMKVTHTYR